MQCQLYNLCRSQRRCLALLKKYDTQSALFFPKRHHVPVLCSESLSPRTTPCWMTSQVRSNLVHSHTATHSFFMLSGSYEHIPRCSSDSSFSGTHMHALVLAVCRHCDARFHTGQSSSLALSCLPLQVGVLTHSSALHFTPQEEKEFTLPSLPSSQLFLHV